MTTMTMTLTRPNNPKSDTHTPPPTRHADSTFAGFDLAAEFRPILKRIGYTEPTPVQREAIPRILEGADLIACAQTGSGKTAAYMLPILTLCQDFLAEGPRPKGPFVLVLVPTRELASQVVEMATPFADAVGLRVCAVYGGVGMRPQIDQLRKGVEIVVATPGRLLDHMASGRLDWQDLELLVLDEADRMLDIGFLPDIRRIVQHLPKERQTLLLSATMPAAVRRLAESIMREPKRITIGTAGHEQPTIPQGITHGVFLVNPQRKAELLLQLLDEDGTDSVLVFTRTKAGADRLGRTLERRGIRVECIHGDLNQKQRARALAIFKDAKCQVLVATDVAARGLDIEGISHVINYDMPQTSEDYVHRVGRTGRADATGDAFTFVAPEDYDALLSLEQATGLTIPRLEREGLTYSGAKPRHVRPRGRRNAIRRW